MDFEGAIGKWIKQRRKVLDLTRTELGNQVGCSAEYIRKIEQGTRRPSKDLALRLAEALHVLPEHRGKFIMYVRSVPSNEQAASPPLRSVPVRVSIKLIGRHESWSKPVRHWQTQNVGC